MSGFNKGGTRRGIIGAYTFGMVDSEMVHNAHKRHQDGVIDAEFTVVEEDDKKKD